MRHLLLGLALAAAEAVDVTTAAQVRPLGRSPVSLPGTNGDTPPLNGKWPRREATLPVHRSILAVDIEDSTRRTNTVKEELRQLVYQLVLESLDVAGIDDHYYDPFTDRGDGVPVLVRTADEFPKPLLLSCLIPALALVASDYIYQSIIRHGYAGIDDGEFLPLVTVNVGDQRRKGWVQMPRTAAYPVPVSAQAYAC